MTDAHAVATDGGRVSVFTATVALAERLTKYSLNVTESLADKTTTRSQAASRSQAAPLKHAPARCRKGAASLHRPSQPLQPQQQMKMGDIPTRDTAIYSPNGRFAFEKLHIFPYSSPAPGVIQRNKQLGLQQLQCFFVGQLISLGESLH